MGAQTRGAARFLRKGQGVPAAADPTYPNDSLESVPQPADMDRDGVGGRPLGLGPPYGCPELTVGEHFGGVVHQGPQDLELLEREVRDAFAVDPDRVGASIGLDGVEGSAV
jgi:hypothetical protein